MVDGPTYAVPEFSADRSGPDDLVSRLRDWGQSTDWCEWIELSGSLGRGAGDAWSDLDAGAGIVADAATFDARVDEVLTAVTGFAPVADVEPTGRFGDMARHLQVQYADGRQLSLVVMIADTRPGLPPQSIAVVDKAGRLSTVWEPSSAREDGSVQRERVFTLWWLLGDVAKHTRRGAVWRAVEALHEARGQLWQVIAAGADATYPRFGVVTVQNAGIDVPAGMEATLPASVEPTEVLRAAWQLAQVVDEVAHRDDVAGVRAISREKLRAAQDAATAGP